MPEQLTTITRDRWLEIMAHCTIPEPEPPIRRKSRRYGVEFGVVRMLYRDEGASIDRTLPLLQISAEGLMVKSHSRMQMSTPVRMEVTLEDDMFALRGRVAHSTQTVGGYKVGIELEFPDDGP